MAVKKRSIALDAEIAEDVMRAAAEDEVSVSAWLSEAARQRLRIRRGLRGVAAWEASAGKLSAEERAAGEELVEKILATKPSSRRRAG